MGNFIHDTHIEALSARADPVRAYRAELHPDWEIWGPNGGYLCAIALRAMLAEAQVPRPASFTAHFLAVGRFEPVEIQVELLRRGRSAESLRARVAQGGRVLLQAILRTAALAPGLEHRHGAAPAVARPDELLSADELRARLGAPQSYPFWQNLEGRPIEPRRPGTSAASDPVWREWFRFRPQAVFDDPAVDHARALLLLDTMGWPAAVQRHPESAYIAPSLDLHVLFHASDPSSEWLLADHDSPVGRDGLIATRGRIWSESGQLLASGASQLLCVPAPRAP